MKISNNDVINLLTFKGDITKMMHAVPCTIFLKNRLETVEQSGTKNMVKKFFLDHSF